MTANEPGDQSPGLALRAVDRSPLLQQRRARSMQQVQIMIDAAKRLICLKGSGFTTQELARDGGGGVRDDRR